MSDLSTSYLGLPLSSPVIAASSRLTAALEGLKKCEGAGAGAVVLKSIFEEQIEFDANRMIAGMDSYSAHADGYDFLTNSSKDYHIDRYLELVEQAREALSIPVIASVNCVNPGTWLDYAHRFQEVGADALEINMFIVPADIGVPGTEVENRYFILLKRLLNTVDIPVALKLGSHFSGMAHFMKQLDTMGVNGLVLFNRYYRPDININTMQPTAGSIVSVEEESALSLQWTALLSGSLDADICANTGIHTGKTMIKHLLAGAAAVQVCSALMQSGYKAITKMNEELAEWMTAKTFSSIADFKGLLNREHTETPEVWERSQYIKAVSGIS